MTIKDEKSNKRQKEHQSRLMRGLSRSLLYQGIIKQVYMTKMVVAIKVAAGKGQGKSHLPE